MSAAPERVLTTSGSRRDGLVLATWLERHDVTYDRLLAVLIPLTLVALVALLCIGGVGGQL